MPCSVYSQRYAAQNLRNALNTLQRGSILPTSQNYLNLQRVAGDYSVKIGFGIPKPITFILKLFGLSPGTLAVFHDADSGFGVEARATPGAPPFYHHISDDEAVSIFQGEMTPELHDRLFLEDDYQGE